MGFKEFKKTMSKYLEKVGYLDRSRFELDTDKGRYLCFTPEGLFTGNSDGNITLFYKGRALRVKPL